MYQSLMCIERNPGHGKWGNAFGAKVQKATTTNSTRLSSSCKNILLHFMKHYILYTKTMKRGILLLLLCYIAGVIGKIHVEVRLRVSQPSLLITSIRRLLLAHCANLFLRKLKKYKLKLRSWVIFPFDRVEKLWAAIYEIKSNLYNYQTSDWTT